MSLARALFVAGTIPFIVAAGGHGLGALYDVRRPTFFTPADDDLRARMHESGVRGRALFPGRSVEHPSMWSAWLGFNISHGLGGAVFGITNLTIGLRDFDAARNAGLLPLAVLVAAGYLVLAIRFWFWAPTTAVAIATTCFAVAWVLA